MYRQQTAPFILHKAFCWQPEGLPTLPPVPPETDTVWQKKWDTPLFHQHRLWCRLSPRKPGAEMQWDFPCVISPCGYMTEQTVFSPTSENCCSPTSVSLVRWYCVQVRTFRRWNRTGTAWNWMSSQPSPSSSWICGFNGIYKPMPTRTSAISCASCCLPN